MRPVSGEKHENSLGIWRFCRDSGDKEIIVVNVLI